MSSPNQPLLRSANPEDASALAVLKVLCWRSTYEGLMPKEILDRLDAEREASHWRDWLADLDAGLSALVLEREGALIGYCLAGAMREKGDNIGEDIPADAEIYAFYMRPDCQRQGLGRSLMKEQVDVLRQTGFSAVGAWMLFGNKNAERFYRKIEGQAVAKRLVINHGRIAFREIGWFWPDLQALQARLTLKTV